jgi:aryl carrier-like protein
MTQLAPEMTESLDALWAGLPGSNVFRQKKLTGEAAGAPETRTGRCDGLQHVTVLGAYHLVLQWYLDDVESLIGCCVANGTATTIRASYVYSEDEDSVAQLLGDIERQLREGRALEVGADEPIAWDAKRVPVFFFAAGNARVPEGCVVVAAEAGEVVVSMPFASMDADDFQRRFDSALRALASGGHATVGELRAQLGDAAAVPYRQLDEMQRRLIDLWARVLGVPETTLDASSSYFEVGGTSLNAFKLVNRVRLELQRDVSIRDIIENPTIQEFSRLLLKE